MNRRDFYVWLPSAPQDAVQVSAVSSLAARQSVAATLPGCDAWQLCARAVVDGEGPPAAGDRGAGLLARGVP